MKKETIKEAAQRLFPVNNIETMFLASRDELNNALKQKGFIECAKWQAEQEPTYTPEEVEFIKRAVEYYWQDWNQEHPDNENDYKLTQQILSK
jgi:hypothetical protein